MLLCRSHWHFAFERDPFGEARLVRFAGPPPLPPDSAYGPKEGDPDLSVDQSAQTANADIERAQQEARAQAEAVIKGEKPLVDGSAKKASGESETQKSAEELREADAIRKKESMRTKFSAAAEAVKKQISTLQDLRLRMDDPGVQKQLKAKASPEIQDRWEKDRNALEREEGLAGKDVLFLEAVQSFWEGQKSPQEFLEEFKDQTEHLPFGFDTIGKKVNETASNIGALSGTAGIDENEWLTKNESTRIMNANQFLQTVDIDGWLASTQGQYAKMEKALKQQELWVKSIEDQANAITIAEQNPEVEGIWKVLGRIRFYSINNYLHGIQKYWAALMKTLEDRNERYDADIARNIGDMMQYFDFWPLYGTEVDQVLSQQLDAKSNEEAEAMKKSLEGDNVKWEGLFGKNGEFNKYAGKNANKTRGILDYAAEKGFLYDIDEDLHNHDHPIFGRKLTDICYDWVDAGDKQKVEDYFTKLRGANASGREHEIDHGYKMEYDVENVPRFIELLEHELDEHNLWAAAGVCKRAMERGLDGKVAAWLFTTVMNKLREYPALREKTPVAFFDIIGKLSMYQTAFTMGWAKGYRNQLRLWAKTGDEEILNKQTELKHMNAIQQEIIESDPRTDYTTHEGRTKLNSLVAKVLASQIVELPNHHYIHIFQNKFKGYREMAKRMFASTADPLKEDSDYATEITEKVMLPQVVFKDILAYTSTFEFKNESWVQGFLGSVIEGARQLKAIPELRDAYNNYCMEVREKMDLHFGSFMHEERAIKQLSTFDANTNPPKPALASLIAEKLLSRKSIKSEKIRKELDVQLADNYYDFYEQEVLSGNSDKKSPSPKPIDGVGGVQAPSGKTQAA